jgi:hypothetical protein
MQDARLIRRYFCIPILIFGLAGTLLAQSTQPASAPNTGAIDFRILDSAPGYAVSSATIKWDIVNGSVPATLSNSGSASSGGKFERQLSPGEYAFEISVPGYQQMRTHFAVAQGLVGRANINLDPTIPPHELRDDVVASELRDEFELVHGYVVDAITHHPIGGVQLRLQESGSMTTSNSRGYFQLYAVAASSADAVRPEDLPATDTLTATFAGYKTYVVDGLFHVPGNESVVRVEMVPGSGTSQVLSGHTPMMPSRAVPDVPPPAVAPISNTVTHWLEGSGTALLLNGSSGIKAASTTASISLPTSIRVGSNCTNGKYGCTVTNTYSLEIYVQDGLENEWVSSWNVNALQAGAVAYRSYGGWFVAHPICPTIGSSCPTMYDICRYRCKQ